MTTCSEAAPSCRKSGRFTLAQSASPPSTLPACRLPQPASDLGPVTTPPLPARAAPPTSRAPIRKIPHHHHSRRATPAATAGSSTKRRQGVAISCWTTPTARRAMMAAAAWMQQSAWRCRWRRHRCYRHLPLPLEREPACPGASRAWPQCRSGPTPSPPGRVSGPRWGPSAPSLWGPLGAPPAPRKPPWGPARPLSDRPYGWRERREAPCQPR